MGLLLKQSTAAVISFGPFVDKTDGVTLEIGLVDALDHAATGIMLSKNGGALTIRHAAVTATTYDAHGCYRVTLDPTDTNTLGRLRVMYSDPTTCLPVWQDYQVVTANVWETFCGEDKLETDVVQWLGTTCPAPTTAGYPRVAPDWAQIENKTSAADLSSTQIASVNTKTGYELSATGVTAVQSGLSTLTAQQVWEYATRTLSSFGTLVSDIATAVWGAVSRTFTGAAENAIDAQAIKADAVTKIQNGLATPTNITAGTITTTTNVTNAPTNGDLTATQKTSVQAAVAAALDAAIPAEPTAGSINERMDWIEEMSEDAP